MRDQYAGDVTDWLKLSLLRALARSDRKLGVAWYYVPGDDYRKEAHLRGLDEEVWNALTPLPRPSVEELEKLSVWPPGTCFHRKPVPDAARDQWAQEMVRELKECRLVFLDPDNGIGDTKKHARMNEIKALRHPERAIVVIQFPGRDQKHEDQIDRWHKRLLGETGCGSVVTLTTSVRINQPSIRWFTIIDADEKLKSRAQAFAKNLEKQNRCRGSLFPMARLKSAAE